MPTYEYRCEPCNAQFEEILTQTEDVKKYSDWHPCPNCGGRAERIASAANFQFSGGVRGTSGVHGNSGVHDLDYPVLDKAVARSAEKKWEIYGKRAEEREKVRKETGAAALAVEGGEVKPANPENLKVREQALTTFKNVKSSSDE